MVAFGITGPRVKIQSFKKIYKHKVKKQAEANFANNMVYFYHGWDD